jgi:hypothetical protein
MANHRVLTAYLIQWGAKTSFVVDSRYRSPIHYAAEMGDATVRGAPCMPTPTPPTSAHPTHPTHPTPPHPPTHQCPGVRVPGPVVQECLLWMGCSLPCAAVSSPPPPRTNPCVLVCVVLAACDCL